MCHLSSESIVGQRVGRTRVSPLAPPYAFVVVDTTGSDELHEELVINASMSTAWQALVDGERRRQWWSNLEIDPVVGGQFTERWVGPDGAEVLTKGLVMDVVPARLLRLRWADENWPAQTEVEIRLAPSDRGTIVQIRHAGWRLLPDGQHLAEEHRVGWRLHLSNLRAHLEQ